MIKHLLVFIVYYYRRQKYILEHNVNPIKLLEVWLIATGYYAISTTTTTST
jgi:hypothetical protein